MKRTLLVLAFPLLLGGCAQIFDANVFGTIDLPPKLSSSALKTASPEEIKNKLKDDSFVEQLKEDPEALAAAQEALNSTINSTTATDEEKLAAGSTMIELTTNGSGVAEMKADAVANVTTISDAISAGLYTKALKIFMGDQTEAEMKVTLNNLLVMATSLGTMQTLSAKTDGTLDPAKFYSGTTDRGSFAQSALMAAIATALIKDTTGTTDALRITALAANLAQATPTEVSGGTDLTEFVDAKDADEATYTTAMGTSTASNYCYTYVAILVPELAVGL